MASQKNFAITPSVSISRSKFRRPSQHKTAFNLGDIIPIYVDADILPGDTVSLDLAALVRMSTPVAPIMDNIFIDYYAFFVPNRLIWTDWKKFMGENTSGYGVAGTVTYPQVSLQSHSPGVMSIGDFMGLPAVTGNVSVSALPGRAYYSIYNFWFRDQNLISPINVALTSGAGYLGTDPNNSNAQLYYDSLPLKAAKESDYFTRALPYAQKGNPVTLPLGSTAPVIGASTLHDLGTDGFKVASSLGTYTSSNPLVSGTGGAVQFSNNGVGLAGVDDVSKINLVADLSTATAATINQLRFAFQYQKMLEKDAQPFYRASINCAISVNA